MGEKKPTPNLAPVAGVGDHAGAVIFAEHDEDTGTDKQPQETRFEESRAGRGRRRHGRGRGRGQRLRE